MKKEVARHLARALDEMSRALFLFTSRDRDYQEIDRITKSISELFKRSGYEFADPDSVRIRRRKLEVR